MALITAGLTVACIALPGPAAQAQQPPDTPLTASDFKQVEVAPQGSGHPNRGFGDRNNSWTESMVYWRGHVYVGTTRQSECGAFFAIWDFAALAVSPQFADAFLPYPPPATPDFSCPPGPNLSLQAENWRGTQTPGGTTWVRVFQSPLTVPNPGPAGHLPPCGFPAYGSQPPGCLTGKKVPYEIAIRGLVLHTELDGTEALYAFGVTTGGVWDQAKLPRPRILRSTDGVTFTPVPQTTGTFLGDLPFRIPPNPPDHTSYRSPVSFAGKLFVLSGPLFGQGTVIASADPAKGDNAWFLAGPEGLVGYVMGAFNGWLYVGTFDPVKGYAVVKTRAEGPPSYTFVTVVPSGAGLTVMPSGSAVSMHEFFGRLYVGTATFTEVIRINPDDTWDLVVGAPRAVPLPNGGSEWKYPLSGLDAGFGTTVNDHAWSMGDFDNDLYIGTYNFSTFAKSTPVLGPLLRFNRGANLYRTHDDWYYSAVTTSGFSNLPDPLAHGRLFDFGIRSMATTPSGLFLGTTNDFWGLAIFRGTPSLGPPSGFHSGFPSGPLAPPDPPQRVEIEPTRSGSALLSWKASPRAIRYQIWRAERNPIMVRTAINVEGLIGGPGGTIPDVYIGQNLQIGVSPNPAFIDATVQPGHRYMYYVLADQQGKVSDQSNLVAFPLLTPAVTFAQLLQEVDLLDQRRRFRNSNTRMTDVRQEIVAAQTLAARCQIGKAINKLDPQKAFKDVLEPDATGLEILISKLVRRLQLFNQFPKDVSSNEFCT